MSWVKAILTRRGQKCYRIHPQLLPERPTPAIESILYTNVAQELHLSSCDSCVCFLKLYRLCHRSVLKTPLCEIIMVARLRNHSTVLQSMPCKTIQSMGVRHRGETADSPAQPGSYALNGHDQSLIANRCTSSPQGRGRRKYPPGMGCRPVRPPLRPPAPGH